MKNELRSLYKNIQNLPGGFDATDEPRKVLLFNDTLNGKLRKINRGAFKSRYSKR